MATLLDLATKLRKNVSDTITSFRSAPIPQQVQRLQQYTNPIGIASAVAKPIVSKIANINYTQPFGAKQNVRVGDVVNNWAKKAPQAFETDFSKAADVLPKIIQKPVKAAIGSTVLPAGRAFTQAGMIPFNTGRKPLQKVQDALGAVGAYKTLMGGLPGLAASQIPGGFNAGVKVIQNKAAGKKPMEGVGDAYREGMQTGYQIKGFTNYSTPVLAKTMGAGPVVKVMSKLPGAKLVADRVAPAVANVAEGVALSKAQGMPVSPQSIAIDAATGAIGGRGQFEMPVKMNIAKTMHPEDAQWLDRATDIFRKKDKNNRALATQVIDSMAEAYLPREVIDRVKGNPSRMIQALQKMSRNVDYSGMSDTFPARNLTGGSARGESIVKTIMSGIEDSGQQSKPVMLKPLYHGGVPFDKNKITDRGFSLSSDKSIAAEYSTGVKNSQQFQGGEVLKGGIGSVQEYYLAPEAKILNVKDAPIDLLNFYNKNSRVEGIEKISQWAKQNGYDAVDFGKMETRVLNPSILKTKSIVSDLSQTTDAQPVGPIANQRLDYLMNDPNRLLKMGYTKSQVDRIGAKEARRIIEEQIPPFEHSTAKTMGNASPQQFQPQIGNKPVRVAGNKYQQFQPTKEEADQVAATSYMNEMEQSGLKRWFNSVFNPIKNAPQEVQDLMQTWRNDVMVSRAKANEVAQMFTDIPEQDGWKLIQYIQNPTNRQAMELGLDVNQYSKQIQNLRSFYDATRQEGIQKGLDIDYLDNYLNQIWKETPGQIDAKIKAGAGRTPGFTKDRFIPSYQEGINLGLTPRFTHPAQLAAHYRFQLDKAMANRKMVDNLVGTEMLLPASSAPAGWQSINSPFFPKVRVDSGGEEPILMDYKAPPDIAKAINNIFEVQEPGLMNMAAKFSKGVQEFALSSGLPFTPLNSFTLANIQKEVMSGRVKGPAVATALSFSDSAAANYFKNNQKVIQDMASEGIPTFTNTDYTSMYKNMAENKNFIQQIFGGAKEVFDSAFNESTFKRFMPILQTEFYKDAYKSALDSGVDQAQARGIAAAATRNFYGITDNFSRSGSVEDTLSAFIMAPKFREAMIGFWGNTLKSLHPRTFSDPAFAANRKFIVGAAITYGLYNLANKQLTGRWMGENKDGKELSLEIPMGNGRSFYMPFLFTIGTVPRRFAEAAGELAGGDIAGATQKMTSFASIPVSAASQMLTNRNFYGGQIYDDEDPAMMKLGKALAAGFGQMSHPWIRTGVELATGQRTLAEATPGLLELPLYPSASSDVSHLKGKQVTKFKELMAVSPASAHAFSERAKAEQKMKEGKAAVKASVENSIKKTEPGFFEKMFGAQAKEATPDMINAYFGVDEYDLLPEGSAFDRAKKEGERKAIVTNILTDEDVTPDQKINALRSVGEEVDSMDIEYYQVAKLTDDVKLGFVKDYLGPTEPKEYFESLLLLTQKVNDSKILSSGVIDDLVKEGLISKDQGKALKNTTYDKKTGQFIADKKAGSGRKVSVKGEPPKTKIPSFERPKAKITVAAPKLPSTAISFRSSSPKLTQASGGGSSPLVAMSNVKRRKPMSFRKVKVRSA